MNDYLTVKELALAIGKTESTINTYISRGKKKLLPRWYKVGGQVRFKLKDVEYFERGLTI